MTTVTRFAIKNVQSSRIQVKGPGGGGYLDNGKTTNWIMQKGQYTVDKVEPSFQHVVKILWDDSGKLSTIGDYLNIVEILYE